LEKLPQEINLQKNNSLQRLPRIGITIGDAAGIGPEITLKALADENIAKICQPLIIGDAKFLQSLSKTLKLPIKLHVVKKDEQIPNDSTDNLVYDLANLPDEVPLGGDFAVTGKAAAENIETAVRLWKENKIDAIATAPISKRAIQMGGYNFPGHTEFLAELTGTKEFAMSFFADKLRVVLLSIHVSLRDAIALLKKERLVELIVFTNRQMENLLQRKVKIAVAGLNPHASEEGLFGNEEANEIIPAIAECREKFGIDVSGAYSPDTIFLRGYRGEFDAVVACYHDQATIAVKCLSFGASVNVTLGLPLVRTSVDHGTAYDIAGKFIADESSMKAAVRLAANLSVNS
jgi:4-hydroxythreonine-4-phosphate dehydrogenase